jgi:hypothetical protein
MRGEFQVSVSQRLLEKRGKRKQLENRLAGKLEFETMQALMVEALD